MLAPRQARELTAARRERIGDYLLGQQTGLAERLQTRTYLEGSAPGRAWANAISVELAPLAAAPLPEIPGGAGPPGADAHYAGDEASSPRASIASPPRLHAPTSLPSSRRGGALLLAAIAAAAVVAVILIAGGGSSGSPPRGDHRRPVLHRQSLDNLESLHGRRSKRRQAAEPHLTRPRQQGCRRGRDPLRRQQARLLPGGRTPAAVQGLFYAVWLYNSPTSHEALSRSPAVGSNGRLQGGALLPSNAGEYHTMLLTRETNERPARPGPVVLSGAFALH